MILPRGICERPNSTNVHCNVTYNSTVNTTDLDAASGARQWEQEMIEEFQNEFGTFSMCRKSVENIEDCKIGNDFFYPLQRNATDDTSLFCVWCILTNEK